MKKFLHDFKEFAMKGNIVDMAVGVVIGGAFGKIVSSLVADIITPLLGILLGHTSFTDLKWVIHAADGEVAELALTYGNFIQSVIDFLIIAFSIFVVLRITMNAKKRFVKEEEKAAEEPAGPTPEEIKLETLQEIRDLLKEKSGK